MMDLFTPFLNDVGNDDKNDVVEDKGDVDGEIYLFGQKRQSLGKPTRFKSFEPRRDIFSSSFLNRR